MAFYPRGAPGHAQWYQHGHVLTLEALTPSRSRAPISITSSRALNNMSNKERSYIMGHQSTVSIGRYGGIRSGTGACSISAGASQGEVNSVKEIELSDYFTEKLPSKGASSAEKDGKLNS